MSLRTRIQGLEILSLKKHEDERGWLAETFRLDELSSGLAPKMSYISFTKHNQIRGPHEHLEQTDFFIFPGPGDFKIYLWDNKDWGDTYKNHIKMIVGGSNPVKIIIPPRIVHGYKSVSKPGSYCINYPNRLFKGFKKESFVDEIRYENDLKSPFKIK